MAASPEIKQKVLFAASEPSSNIAATTFNIMLTDSQIAKMKKELSGTEQLRNVFGALGDSSRLQIFQLLMKHKEICVSEIAKVLGISVPGVSQQMKILEISGLVKGVRMGQKICYEIKKDEPAVKSLTAFLNKNLT